MTVGSPAPKPRRRQPRRRLRRLLTALGLGGVLAALAPWIVVGRIIAPSPRSIDTLPTGLPTEEVTFDSGSGSRIHGWFTAGRSHRGTIVLMHGSRGDRRAMLGRVRFLHEAGYATLTIDLQGHGESPGSGITFGHLESQDAHAAVAFCRRRRPGKPVAVIGESLGGAAALLGSRPVPAEAIILEMVFPELERAIANRIGIHLGTWGAALLTPLLTVQCGPRLGIEVAAIRPIDAIQRIRAPVFVLGGELDERTPPDETRALFDAAPDPKQLWIVKGAGHRNLHGHAGAEYEARILAFLEEHLP